MFGLSVKFENNNDTLMLRTSLLCVVLLSSVAILASFIISSSSASATVAMQSQVSLTSKVYVIRTEKNADGVEQEVLKTPNDVVVIPGDRLKFILSYKNETGQIIEGFKAVNPMPNAVQFSQVAEEWAEISIDGGKNWGELQYLTVETKLPSNAAITSNAAQSDTAQSDTPESNAAESDTPESDTAESDTPESDTAQSDTPESDTVVKRAAGVADVTHVRWVFDKPIEVGESGELSFEGVVK